MEHFLVMTNDYIRFVYSLSFVVLAFVSFLMLKIQPSNRLWRWLSLFSILYATGLFCDIFRAFSGYNFFIEVKIVLITLAFYCLFEYSRRETNEKYKTTIQSWWLLALILVVVLLDRLITGHFDFLDELKYFIGAPVCFWTAIIILLVSGVGRLRYSLILLLMFFIFGVLQTQIDTSQSLYRPASIIHLTNAFVVLFATFALWKYFHAVFSKETKSKEKLLAATIVFFIVLFISWLFVGLLGKSKEQELERFFIAKAKIASVVVSPDIIKNLKGSEEDLKTYDYQRIKTQLSLVLEGERDAKFIYIMGQRDNNIIFYVDAEPETSKDYASPGSVYSDFPKPLLREVFIAGDSIVHGPYTDKWGSWISSFVPIKDIKTKKVVAVLGMDTSSDYWVNAIIGQRLFAISLSMLVFLLLLILNLSRYLSKISENTLKRSQELFNEKVKEIENFFNVSPDLLNITDADGRFVRVSSSCEKILGYKPEELQNKKYLEMVHPDDVASTLVEAASLSEDKPVLAFTNRYRKKDGSYVWIEWYSNPQENGFVYSSARDVTDSYLQKEKLLKNNLLLTTHQNVSIDGILSVDEEGKIISYNEGFTEMWGISSEVVESRSDEVVLNAVLGKLVNPQEFIEKAKYLYSNRKEKGRDEIKLIDGSIFDRYSAPMFTSDDTYYGRVWFFRDITESKRAEETLRNVITKNPMSIQVLDRDGFTLTTNVAYRNLFGVVSPPSDYSMFNDVQLNKMGTAPFFERLKNGEDVLFPDTKYNAHNVVSEALDTLVWIRTIGFSLKDSFGKPERFILMHDNITDRKLAEDTIRESAEKFKSVVDNIGIGISILDTDMNILSVNNTMLEYFPKLDVSKKPCCYKTYNNPPRTEPCTYCPVVKTLKDGKVLQLLRKHQ